MWTGILIGLVLLIAVLLLVSVCAPNLVPARMRWSASGADDDEADDDANDASGDYEVDEVDDDDNGDADNGADDNADDVNIDDNMLPTSTRQGAASFANPVENEVKLLTSRPEMDQVSDRVFNKSRFGATPSLLTLIHGKGGKTEDDVERTNGVVPGSAS